MFIDSSIFLEVFLKQEISEECRRFLEKVAAGEQQATVSDFNVDGMLLTIGHKTNSVKLMERFLFSLLACSGLSFYFLTIEDRVRALEHAQKFGLDFEDSMTLQAALASGNTTIVSFDRHFDGVPVQRVEPKDIVQGEGGKDKEW